MENCLISLYACLMLNGTGKANDEDGPGATFCNRQRDFHFRTATDVTGRRSATCCTVRRSQLWVVDSSQVTHRQHAPVDRATEPRHSHVIGVHGKEWCNDVRWIGIGNRHRVPPEDGNESEQANVDVIGGERRWEWNRHECQLQQPQQQTRRRKWRGWRRWRGSSDAQTQGDRSHRWTSDAKQVTCWKEQDTCPSSCHHCFISQAWTCRRQHESHSNHSKTQQDPTNSLPCTLITPHFLGSLKYPESKIVI